MLVKLIEAFWHDERASIVVDYCFVSALVSLIAIVGRHGRNRGD